MGGFRTQAHLFSRGGAGFRNRGADCGLDLVRRGDGGKVRLDNFDLLFLLSGELGAAAFVEHVGRFAALFEEGVHHCHLGRFVERLHAVDFLFLQRGFDHPEGAETAFVLCFHRSNDVFLYLIKDGHGPYCTLEGARRAHV